MGDCVCDDVELIFDENYGCNGNLDPSSKYVARSRNLCALSPANPIALLHRVQRIPRTRPVL